LTAERVLLFTQCLQNDFVRPLAPGERLPNQLHIGRDEARRLLGEKPDHGPMARFIRAFYETARRSPHHVSAHIRDWHSADDPAQRAHLEHFGPHCLRDTEGARFAAGIEELARMPGACVIDSPGLSDFEGTPLAALVRDILGGTPPDRVKVGIVGVWTDVKVHYLAYDLLTRLGLERIAVSGALVASRSRARHRAALDHLREMLSVEVLDSVPEFLRWLEVDATVTPPEVLRPARFGTEVATRAGDLALGDEERSLLGYLFRDARRVEVSRLAGGFSGSRVFRTRSEDGEGRVEVPFVVKVDTHARIAQERVAVESVESLLGAASPVISEWVDGETLGAIKYGFASMLGRSETRTLLARLRKTNRPEEIRRIFEPVFRVLERLHQAPRPERIQLFRWFTYRPEYAAATLERARAIAGAAVDPDVRALERFYERLPRLLAEDPHEVPVSLIHGDLNLANLLQDDDGSTWMIDYFFTRPGPTIQDAAKLENDLRFIAFPADDRSGRREAALEALGEYLGRLLPAPPEPRALAIAGLRYAAHALGFDECDPAQKRAALAAAATYARALTEGS
jgi:hypothetical protein